MLSDPIPIHDTSNAEAPVRGFLHRPSTPVTDTLILTHSAGSNANASLLVLLAEAFCAAGLAVLRCDLPFRQLRPKGPPIRSAERDQRGLHAAVDLMRRDTPGRIFLGGHSYGGRMASILVSEQPGLVDSLLLLSYPLHPPQKSSQLRTAHFPSIHTPALFVSGERDAFGTTAEIVSALALIPAPTELLPIPAAGHELLTKQNRPTLPSQIIQKFLSFSV